MRHAKRIEHIKVGRRADESEQLPHNWEILDVNNLDIAHGKIVFMFGGNTTNRLEAGNGNIKIIESTIDEENSGKARLFSFVYETEPLRSDGFLSKEYINEALMLFENTFKPMLFDENGNMKEPKGIEHVFHKFIFTDHCGGSSFVNIIINQFYNVLIQKYPTKMAEMLVNKIKCFSYAPSEMFEHNVSALVVTPYEDTSFSFIKALELAENQKVDVDYPKGVVKKLLKAKQSGNLRSAFNSVFENTRVIMFKVGNSTYLIPNQMNPMKNIGDHSIECFAKLQFLHSGQDCEKNAQLVNYAVRKYINEFIACSLVDSKRGKCFS